MGVLVGDKGQWQEGDVRALPGDDLRAALAGLRLRFPKETDDLVAAIRETRIGREWWRVFLGAALVVLALELFLAWYFSRRMRVVEQAPRVRGEEWPRFGPARTGS